MNVSELRNTDIALIDTAMTLLLCYCNEQVVLTAHVVVVSLDEAYRPLRLSSRVKQLMLSGQPIRDADGRPLASAWT